MSKTFDAAVISDVRKQLAKLPDDCATAIFNCGNDLHSLKTPPEVVEQFYLRAISAGEIWAYHNLGNLKYEMGQGTEALAWWVKAWEHGDPGGAFMAGQTLEEAGQLDRALKAFRFAGKKKHKGYHKNPYGRGRALFGAVRILRNQGKNDEAIALLNQIAEFSWEAATDLARFELDVDEGIELLERYLAKGDHNVCITLAILYERAGQPAKAKQLLKQEAKRKDVWATTNLGVMYEEEGRLKKARKLYKWAAKRGDELAESRLFNIEQEYVVTSADQRVIDSLLSENEK